MFFRRLSLQRRLLGGLRRSLPRRPVFRRSVFRFRGRRRYYRR